MFWRLSNVLMLTTNSYVRQHGFRGDSCCWRPTAWLSSEGADGSGKSSVCWNCLALPPAPVVQKSLPENFCTTCESIQPPEPGASPFDLLSVPRQFHQDAKSMERTYLNLQRRLHPDFYQAKSKMEQVYAEARSSQLNKAYQILKSPTKRAQLLLTEAGVNLADESKSYESDPEFLLRVMEMRETLDALPDDASAAAVAALRAMREQIAADMEAASRAFAVAFAGSDLQAGTKHAVQMIYLEKLANLISERLPAE